MRKNILEVERNNVAFVVTFYSVVRFFGVSDVSPLGNNRAAVDPVIDRQKFIDRKRSEIIQKNKSRKPPFAVIVDINVERRTRRYVFLAVLLPDCENLRFIESRLRFAFYRNVAHILLAFEIVYLSRGRPHARSETYAYRHDENYRNESRKVLFEHSPDRFVIYFHRLTTLSRRPSF